MLGLQNMPSQKQCDNQNYGEISAFPTPKENDRILTPCGEKKSDFSIANRGVGARTKFKW